MQTGKVLGSSGGAVASEHPLASAAGADALGKGGNAFDAAVAVSFTLAVTQHHIGGVGGDFFGMFYEAGTGRVRCLNSSGWAPSGLTLDLVRSKGADSMPTSGPLSCVVPGQVAGVWSMHERLGRLKFGDLLGPARVHARGGFPASPGLCRSIAAALDTLSPEARAVFAPSGKAPSPGDRIVQPRLAGVIDGIAAHGPSSFYRGPPADQMREALEGLGVPADVGDFSEFKPEWVDPLVLDYRGTKVYETPPNSMGATTLLMLKLLSRSDLSKAGPLSKDRVVLTMEAAETAYARKDRMLGDPRFARIDMGQFMSVAPSERHHGSVAGGDTTAFSVADKEGNLVSAIQSLFRHFGSRVFVPECGIMLNSRASGFRTSGPNVVQPRKRPLHTLSSLVLEGETGRRTAIGTSGGDYRPLQHAQFVSDVVDYGLSLEETVEHPRFVWSEGRELVVEEGYERLGSTRYDVQLVQGRGRTGVCQGAEVLGQARKAVCDSRGDGLPAGV